jgi:excisionase family DNA binding protein
MSEPTKNPFDLLVDQIREAVREELAVAIHKQKPPKLLLSAEEAAPMIGVKPSWLATAAREGKIPSVRCGHYVKFKISDLEKYIEAQRPPNEKLKR